MKGKFDVFHIDGERSLRGGERQLLYLACALRERGHRNVVVCRPASPLAADARRLGLETKTLPFWMEWDPFTAVPLRRAALASARPVLHAHTAHAAGIAALASALGRPIPRVLHRRVDFSLNGGLSRRLKYDPAQSLVAVSAAIRKVLAGSGMDPARIEVVPDAVPADDREAAWAGVAPGLFAPPSDAERAKERLRLAEEFGVPASAAWVGNIAALVPHKDHDTLFAAALIVLLKRPNTVFLVAGEGPEGPRLLEQIKRLGLLGRLLLIGQRDDPLSLLKALDVFVLSSWGEGMGSVLLEASACSVPIAATSAGGIPEIVDHERSGLLCPPRDPEALAANIIRLLDERAMARGLAEQARRQLPRFGLKNMAERMEAIYEAVA